MAGNKNSGRRKKSENGKSKSILKKKMTIKPKNTEKMQVIENTKELKSEENQKIADLEPLEPPKMVEKNDDFDEIGKSIAAQSAAALENEKLKENESAPADAVAGAPATAANGTPAADLPSDEGWEPVVGLTYLLVGEVGESVTGSKHMNYTEEEIEIFAAEWDKIIRTLWPNAAAGLTEEQKVCLFSGSIIFKMHMQKFGAYLKEKEEKERLQNASGNTDDKKPA